MALTLAEGAKLSNDVLQQGVIETVINDSPVLQRLPFVEIVRQRADLQPRERGGLGCVLAVGDTWTESTPTFTQITASLTIVGGDADIDNYIARTRNNVQDIEAAVVELKAKAVQQKFDDSFITGDTGTGANAFDGIDTLCAAGQTLSMGTNGATLTLDKLDEAVDLVRGGKPEMLLMSRRTRRTLSSLARASGFGVVEHDRDEFGRMVSFYERRADGRDLGRLLDDLRAAVRRGRGRGADRAGRREHRAGGRAGDEGRHARAREVVRLRRAVQRAEARQADRRSPVAAEQGRRPGPPALRGRGRVPGGR